MPMAPRHLYALTAAVLTVIFLPTPAAAVQPSETPPIADQVKAAYIDMGDKPSRFGYREQRLPGARKTVERGLKFVGRAPLACANGTCENKCLHLAAKVWGYAYSGSMTANAHWRALHTAGVTHSDRQPPVGALVFWSVGTAGHVAVYVGDGMVVSNWDGPRGDNVYLLPIDIFEDTWPKATYRGWSEPVFFGPRM